MCNSRGQADIFRYSTDYRQNSPTYPTQPSPYITFCQTLPSICGAYTHAPFLFGVASWATLQLTWTIILLLSQVWQVTRQMTTLEVSNLGRYGFMGGRGGTSLREQGGAMANHMQTSHVGEQISSSATVEALGAGAGQSGAEEDGLAVSNPDHGLTNSTVIDPPSGRAHPAHQHSHGIVGMVCGGLRRLCANGPLLQLLGLDRFTKGAAGRGMKLAQVQGGNPFDMGAIAVSVEYTLQATDRQADIAFSTELCGFLDARSDPGGGVPSALRDSD